MKKSAFLVLVFVSVSLTAQNLFKTSHQLWEPEADPVYLQEVSEKIPLDEPVLSVAVHEDQCFVLTGQKIFRLEHGKFISLRPERDYYSSNATIADGGTGGNVVREPTEFVRDYWMGRYHGFILAPVTTDADLTSVEPVKPGILGAKPYDGPKRPDLY